MRTNDLSKVPRHGRANAVFIGSTEYAGLGALLRLWPKWIRLRRRLRSAPGFCAHYYTYKFPMTFGQVVLFEDMDQMLRFARSKQHRELMGWVVEDDGKGGGKNAKGGFIRLYEARPDGTYATGHWSNEDARTHEDRFVPLSKETEGPYVHPRKDG
jgi:hypothetical protein